MEVKDPLDLLSEDEDVNLAQIVEEVYAEEGSVEEPDHCGDHQLMMIAELILQY